VAVRLPDDQTIRAAVRSRVQRNDGSWWYQVEITLYSTVETGIHLSAESSSVAFLAPAGACSPLPDQDYSSVPTERPRKTPWTIELRPGDELPDDAIVHRGSYRATPAGRRLRGPRRPAS
jgi:hypothetical protein